MGKVSNDSSCKSRQNENLTTSIAKGWELRVEESFTDQEPFELTPKDDVRFIRRETKGQDPREGRTKEEIPKGRKGYRSVTKTQKMSILLLEFFGLPNLFQIYYIS